jgi:hypothetical protein
MFRVGFLKLIHSALDRSFGGSYVGEIAYKAMDSYRLYW